MEPGGEDGPTPGRRSPASAPRWVKVFAVVALAVVLLFAILIVAGGEHGPGRHLPDGPGGHPLPEDGIR